MRDGQRSRPTWRSLDRTASADPALHAQRRHQSWLALREAVIGIPGMLSAAIANESHGRDDALRIARIIQRLYSDAISELDEREAQDVAGATLRLVHDRIVDIYGQEAWDEALRSENP